MQHKEAARERAFSALASRVQQIEMRLPEPEVSPQDRESLALFLPARAVAHDDWLKSGELLRLADGLEGPVGDQLRKALDRFRNCAHPANALGKFLSRCDDATVAGYRLKCSGTEPLLHKVEQAGF